MSYRKFWTVGCTLTNVNMGNLDQDELDRTYFPGGSITRDASYDNHARALLDFGHRVGLIEAFANTKLVIADEETINRALVMGPSEYIIAHAEGENPLRGSTVWIRVQYIQV